MKDAEISNYAAEEHDDLESMLLVMLSPKASDVIFENEFVDDVEHENTTLKGWIEMR